MSLARDLWMTPGKRRLLRRTVANGPYGPPDNTEEFTAVSVPAPNKLAATSDGTTSFVVNDLVIFRAKEGTGTREAREAVETLRASVDAVTGNDFTFGTAPTDLTGIDFTGLVLYVWPV